MMPQVRVELIDQRTREGLGRILDVLIPGTATLPSGREVGAHQEWLDRALEAEPRLLDAVQRVGSAAAAEESLTLAGFETMGGDDADQVVFVLQAAFYMSPAAMKALRYPGQVRRPISEATPEEVWSEELLAPVVARGSIYVPTPEGDSSLTNEAPPAESATRS